MAGTMSFNESEIRLVREPSNKYDLLWTRIHIYWKYNILVAGVGIEPTFDEGMNLGKLLASSPQYGGHAENRTRVHTASTINVYRNRFVKQIAL